MKENDLAPGGFKQWAKDNCSFAPQTAYKFIQAYEQFDGVSTSRLIVPSKIFELLSLPESTNINDFISQQHTIPSTGEEKTVEDMTVKELREVKKALKEAEEKELQYQNKISELNSELAPNGSTWNHLGTQSLYLIATMPEEEHKPENILLFINDL